MKKLIKASLVCTCALASLSLTGCNTDTNNKQVDQKVTETTPSKDQIAKMIEDYFNNHKDELKGDTGATGAQGEKGDTGSQGSKGESGKDGTDGQTPTFSIVNNHIIATYPNGTIIDCGEVNPTSNTPVDTESVEFTEWTYCNSSVSSYVTRFAVRYNKYFRQEFQVKHSNSSNYIIQLATYDRENNVLLSTADILSTSITDAQTLYGALSADIIRAEMSTSDYSYTLYLDTNKEYAFAITDYTGADTSPIIPTSYNNAPVHKIGASCFKNSSITSIMIPTSITSIESSAFYNCSGLTSITIPNGVLSIGSYAFYKCSNVESITLPDSINTIGDYAFNYIGENVKSVTVNCSSEKYKITRYSSGTIYDISLK